MPRGPAAAHACPPAAQAARSATTSTPKSMKSNENQRKSMKIIGLLARPEDTRGRPQGREASPAGPRDIVDTSRPSQDGPGVAREAP